VSAIMNNHGDNKPLRQLIIRKPEAGKVFLKIPSLLHNRYQHVPYGLGNE
jgi:hypothetical protein